jgi:hypothetical protein
MSIEDGGSVIAARRADAEATGQWAAIEAVADELAMAAGSPAPRLAQAGWRSRRGQSSTDRPSTARLRADARAD